MKTVTVSEEANGRYWAKVYEVDGKNLEFTDIAKLPDGNILVAEWTKEGSIGRGLIAKIGPDGSIQWTTQIPRASVKPRSVKIGKNKVAVLGEYTESHTSESPGTYILKMDFRGDLEWIRGYTLRDFAIKGTLASWGGWETILHAIDAVDITKTNSVVGVGTVFNPKSHLEGMIFEIDSRGEPQWSREIPYIQPITLSLTPNGNIAIAGASGDLLLLSREGDVKWHRKYGEQPSITSLAVAPNGDMLLGGSTNSTSGSPILIAIDRFGDVKWILDRSKGDNAWKEQGEISAIAIVPPLENKMRYSIITAEKLPGEIRVAMISHEKDIKWERSIKSPSKLEIRGIEVVGGYIFLAGSLEDKTRRKAWIIKMSLNGDAPYELMFPEVVSKVSHMERGMPKASTVPKKEFTSGFPSALLSRYEPLEFLGEGGFAKVFKVKRRDDGKVVALKIPRIDERTSSLFIKEVAAWYNLNHDNIVRLYKADILPVPYLEMEFVEGVEVDGKLVRDLDAYPKPLGEKTALRLIKEIAEGLRHAHSKGIYHLDLKPLNVLLKSDLTPKITDWGLAKISARSSLTQHYGYSPLYAAPEQLDEETFGVPDHRTDIYQLGLIFYELLAGELPHKATSPGALVGKILYSKPRPVSEINPELKKFDGIFEKLLAKKKEDRYQSVEEFLSALESLGELEREKEELKKTSVAIKRSKSREEFERLKIKSIRQTVAIAVLSAKLNDKALLLEALDDLRFYTRENFDDLVNLIAQVEMLIREGIPISGSLAEKIEVLVRRIEGEVLR